MAAANSNVSRFPTSEPAQEASGGVGGGGGIERRLAAVEAQVAALNARMEYVATKEDVQKIKVWVLGGLIAGLIGAATVAVSVVKLLGQ